MEIHEAEEIAIHVARQLLGPFSLSVIRLHSSSPGLRLTVADSTHPPGPANHFVLSLSTPPSQL